jgi:hypothetical protein
MDTGKGTFKPLLENDPKEFVKKMEELEKEYPEHGGWFREGEIIEIRGSRFRIQSVKPTSLRLKLVNRKEVLNER